MTAYLEAMKNGDVEGMLATFAIETYVAEMDAQADLERMGVFQPSYGMRLPLGGDYQRQVAVAVRYGQLAESLASSGCCIPGRRGMRRSTARRSL